MYIDQRKSKGLSTGAKFVAGQITLSTFFDDISIYKYTARGRSFIIDIHITLRARKKYRTRITRVLGKKII